MSGLNVFVPITKIDAAQRLVYGVATAEAPDRAGEVCDYASTKPHYEKWSGDISKASDGKSLGNLRAMHGKVAAGKVSAISFNDEAKSIEICAKVVDDQEWRKVEEGVYTGFSQGGAYEKRWKDEANPELMRYTAIPSEISLVDLPCLPGATFEVVKADGATEMRKFVEPEPVKAPTNAEIAAKATELAKAAGDEAKWGDHLDAARAELTKAVPGTPELPPEPVAKAADASNNAAPELEQVWKSRDGKTFAKMADAIAHNADLDAAKVAKATAGPAETALSALEAKMGIVKLEPAKAQKAAVLAALLKYAGEEAWDAGRALEALNTIFSLLMGEQYEGEDKTDPDQIAALRSAIAGLKAFIVSELQENNDKTDPLAMAAHALGLAKRGARNNKTDQTNLDAAHDAIVKAGASCGGAEKHVHAEGLEKAAAALDLLKADGIAKDAKIAALEGEFANMTKRLEEILAQPVPPPMLPGSRSVEKGSDGMTDVEREFVKLTPEEQSLALLKIAQRNPQNIMSRG